MATPAPARQRLDRLRDSALTDDIEFLNARARALGSATFNRLLEPLGLRVRSYSVLACACGGLAPTQRQLADFLRLDPSQIVSLVDELESAGLVRREVDPADRRSKIIVATDRGEEVYLVAQRAAREAEDSALAPLSAAERDQLRALMRRVAFPDDED
ncbi:MAG: MarR family transcriptional regulator [Actinomycetales bacterium]|nr:MarR family transcriptional regulator [Actinomycetales bacterium]